MRVMASFTFLAAAALVWATPAPAAAQAQQCRNVNVEGIAQRQVELFDTNATPVTVVSRNRLGEIRVARECPGTPAFLGIVWQGQRWLVRRGALNVEERDVLPDCTNLTHETQTRRRMDSPGVGSAGCRPVNSN